MPPVEDTFAGLLDVGRLLTVGQNERFRAALQHLASPERDLPDWLWPILGEALAFTVKGYDALALHWEQQPGFREVKQRFSRIEKLSRELSDLVGNLSEWELHQLQQRGDLDQPLDRSSGQQRSYKDRLRYLHPEHEAMTLLELEEKSRSNLRRILLDLGWLARETVEAIRTSELDRDGRHLRARLAGPEGQPKARLALSCAALLLRAGVGKVTLARLLPLMRAVDEMAGPGTSRHQADGLDVHAKAGVRRVREIVEQAKVDQFDPCRLRYQTRLRPEFAGWARVEQTVQELFYWKHDRQPLWLSPLAHEATEQN